LIAFSKEPGQQSHPGSMRLVSTSQGSSPPENTATRCGFSPVTRAVAASHRLHLDYRGKPGTLVPYRLSTPAMTLKCQLPVFAVFEPWDGRGEWPHRNLPLMPFG
jgi:hypothetical protein